MNTTKTIFILISLVVGVVIGYVLHTSPSPSPVSLGAQIITQQPTASVVSVSGSTSTQVIATSSVQSYAAIVNLGSTAIDCAVGQPATATSGLRIAANGGAYEMLPNENIFSKAFNCIAQTSTSSVGVLYY